MTVKAQYSRESITIWGDNNDEVVGKSMGFRADRYLGLNSDIAISWLCELQNSLSLVTPSVREMSCRLFLCHRILMRTTHCRMFSLSAQ